MYFFLGRQILSGGVLWFFFFFVVVVVVAWQFDDSYFIFHIRSRELTYPTLKDKIMDSKMRFPGRGSSVSSLIYLYIYTFFPKHVSN